MDIRPFRDVLLGLSFVTIGMLLDLRVVYGQAPWVVLLLAAPFILECSEFIARTWSRSDWMHRAMQLHNIAVQSMAADRRVVICGYGRSGQNLASLHVEVTAVRRRNVRTLTPDDGIRLDEGDVVVLLGLEQDLAAAGEFRLMQG